jgi:hypothetical protein
MTLTLIDPWVVLQTVQPKAYLKLLVRSTNLPTYFTVTIPCSYCYGPSTDPQPLIGHVISWPLKAVRRATLLLSSFLSSLALDSCITGYQLIGVSLYY